MTLPRTTRRHAAVALALIWTLVVGGLAWATRSAIQLDRFQTRAARDENSEVRLERAVRLIEAVVAPVIDQESTRPYDHFKSFYIPAHARDRVDGTDANDRIVVPSPLQTLKGPDWLLLHFQGSDTQGWSSPQLEQGAGTAIPAGAISVAERDRLASYANWLAAIKERYTPLAMLSMLEQALNADISNRSFSTSSRWDWESRSRRAEQERSAMRGETADFYWRTARLFQLQREQFPLYQCEPETVALENLDAVEGATPQKASGGCVQVSRTLMMPVWLDLTMDGRQQLALLRSVSVETSAYCTLQGVLIDWDRLRNALESEIHDLFPQGRLVPIKAREFAERKSQHGTMQRIPVRLEPNETVDGSPKVASRGLIRGLAAAWGATILALAAISYGTLKYVSHSERRMQFVAAVTHELRTPLTSFQLYSDLLAEMPLEDAQKRRQYAQTLGTESKRLARLVENVLAYSRVGDQTPKLSPQDISAATVLDSTASMTAEQCVTYGKKLLTENRCPPDLLIRTDVQFVTQILANLVENACKYSGDAEPRIWVSASPTGGGVVFEVEDAGPGVPARDRRAVFDPFRRGNGEPQRRSSGVGLGLSLSRYWAECLGGSLSIRKSSRNGMHYSCFSLMIPVSPPTVRSTATT
jgi:signal transduction histidine kinase